MQYTNYVQLTRFTDLGLRIVMRLAVEGPNVQLHTSDLAAELCVSYTHATKVVARLSEMGVIESTRGRYGGVCITQEGLGRRVGSLARKLERTGEVIDCDADPPCPFRPHCRLRDVLHCAQDAFFAHLDQWTIAEIACPITERK